MLQSSHFCIGQQEFVVSHMYATVYFITIYKKQLEN